jgi:hypothetical protein
MKRLGVLAISVLGYMGCATIERTQIPPNLIPGEACPDPKSVEFWDGGDIFEIKGTLVTHDDGNAMRPVRSASLVASDYESTAMAPSRLSLRSLRLAGYDVKMV